MLQNIPPVPLPKLLIILYLISMTRSGFLGTQLKRFATFDALVTLGFADLALQSQCNFLCGFCFFVKNWFGLSTKPLLFSIVPSFSLSKIGRFTGFVLSDFVFCVFAAFFAVGVLFFRGVDHLKER